MFKFEEKTVARLGLEEFWCGQAMYTLKISLVRNVVQTDRVCTKVEHLASTGKKHFTL